MAYFQVIAMVKQRITFLARNRLTCGFANLKGDTASILDISNFSGQLKNGKVKMSVDRVHWR